MSYLKLDEIRIDGGTQPRVSINYDTVAEYVEDMKAGQAFPPLEVVFDGAEYWLWDGFHRYHAAKKAEMDTFKSNITNGSVEQARWLSLSTNKSHGLRRTNADKRKAVMEALKLHPEMSDRNIAMHCGVSHPFVAGLRQEQNTPPSTPPPSTPPQQPEPPEEPPNTEPEDNTPPDPGTNNFPPPPGSTPPPSTPPETEPSEAPKEPQGETDMLQREIPEEALEIWNRRGEVQGLMSAISKIKGILQKAQDDQDPLYAGVNFSSVQAELKNAFTEIKACKPYAVCPYCQGFGNGCRACNDTGFVSEFKWNTVVPEEYKK